MRDHRHLGRLISALEAGVEAAERELAARWRPDGTSWVVGTSGPPGVGKSVLTGQLARTGRAKGRRVAVLAVDPSSPRSGGAVLADRIRMQAQVPDGDVFIRSLASRGALGGLSRVVPAAVRALEAAGYDLILVETVGVGQSEVDIARLAETVVVVQAPGGGDEIQGLKAGLLELADVFVLNKCDLAGADQAAAVLREVARAVERDGWRPPVARAIALAGEGVEETWDAIAAHRAWLAATGELDRRRRARVDAELLGAARAELQARMARAGAAELVLRGEATPSEAVRALFGAGRPAGRRAVEAVPHGGPGDTPERVGGGEEAV